ncbi:hypothetical protein ABH925_003747 [Streptacidiphilus sp. EB129]
MIGAAEAAADRIALRLRDGRRLEPLGAADALAGIAGIAAERGTRVRDDAGLRGQPR